MTDQFVCRPGRRPLERPQVDRRYRWLALVPPAGMLGGIPFANRVEPFVLGLPFLLFWVVLWVLVTAGVMAVVAALDDRADRKDGPPPGRP